MIKYIKEIDNNILDIPELKQLRAAQSSYGLNKADTTLISAYYKTVDDFFAWYIDYAAKIVRGKKYSDKQISECVFRQDIKTGKQSKEYLLKSIYISKEYVEYLKNKINATNIQKYHQGIVNLDIDLEWLIANFEVHCRKTVDRIEVNSGRRKNLSPTDLYFAARNLFFIEEADNIQDLYLRDLKPVVIFQIRQSLEVFGRNLVGYYTVVDKAGNPVKKFTQIAWDFIREEIKKPSSRIEFPFDVHMILLINTWAHSFVHTTYIYSCYIQYFALKTVGVLFKSTATGIKIYNGRTTRKFDCADIKITGYNSLKKEFENYLNSKMPGISVDWMDTAKVGAYIISE